MRTCSFIILLALAAINVHAKETGIDEAEKNPSAVNSIILNGENNDAIRFTRAASGFIALNEVIISGVNNDKAASELTAAVAACPSASIIVFRNCKLTELPSNIRMLTNIREVRSEDCMIQDQEGFYNAIADMPQSERVVMRGSDFRILPMSFSRMRVMKSVELINNDMQLASGYDLNTKLPEELIVKDSVLFGFGSDALNLSYTCFNNEACNAHLQMFRDVLQGVYRASTQFYTPVSTRAFTKQHLLVKPPVADVDVQPDVYSFNSMTGSVLNYGSGTRITIPANAFIDARGNNVTGNVDITYREFRDPIDVIFSGIPMKYDSAGQVGDFKSAGMFEINASQNGQEVFVKEGKQLDLKFAVTDTAAEYNFYRLDENKGWVYESNPGTVESDSVATTRAPETGVQTVSPAVRYYMSRSSRFNSRFFLGDTTSFERRYADTNYCGEHYLRVSEKWRPAQKAKRFSQLYLMRVAGGKDYTCVKIRRTPTNSYSNPELSIYAGYTWKLEGRIPSKEIRAKYGRKSGICDIRVIEDGGDYFLEMKHYWGFERIKAEPVRMNHDNKPEDIKDATKGRMFRTYSRHLNSRERRMERANGRAVRKFNRSKDKATQDSINVWMRTQRLMDSTEQGMSRRDWERYARSSQAATWVNLDSATNATSAVYQALSIEGMGIYNCDQVRRISSPVTINMDKIKAGVAAAIPAIVYVISKTANQVFSYFGISQGVEISYGRNDVNTLVAVDKSGGIYVIGEDEFEMRTEEKRGHYSFEGELIDTQLTTPETVRRAAFPERYPD